ncbi:MAG: hypothetical protein LBI94_02075 [Treponema sp.]|nr:hypothetical protein [Treponema sp.]
MFVQKIRKNLTMGRNLAIFFIVEVQNPPQNPFHGPFTGVLGCAGVQKDGRMVSKETITDKIKVNSSYYDPFSHEYPKTVPK